MTQCVSRASQPDLVWAPRFCAMRDQGPEMLEPLDGSRAKQASGQPPWGPQVPTMSGQTTAYFSGSLRPTDGASLDSALWTTPPPRHSAQQATGLTLGPDVARPVWLHRPQSSMAMLATEGCWRLLEPKVQSSPSAGPQAHSKQVSWLPLTRGPCPTWQMAAETHPSLQPQATCRQGLVQPCVYVPC